MKAFKELKEPVMGLIEAFVKIVTQIDKSIGLGKALKGVLTFYHLHEYSLYFHNSYLHHNYITRF